MAERKRVLIKIMGQEFTVVSQEEESYVRELASYVDESIKENLSKNSKLSRNMAYILSAFNIADSFFKEREAFQKFKSETREPIESCEHYKVELDEISEKYEKLKKDSDPLKDDLIKCKREVEKLSKLSEKQQNSIKVKTNEIEDNERIIKELQEKIFNQQKEIMKLKEEKN